MRVKLDRRAADMVAEQMMFNSVRGYTEPAAPGLEFEAIINLMQAHLSRAASRRSSGDAGDMLAAEFVNVAALAFEGLAVINAGKEDPHPIGPTAEQRSCH